MMEEEAGGIRQRILACVPKAGREGALAKQTLERNQKEHRGSFGFWEPSDAKGKARRQMPCD